jgi:hypothetical protein
MKPIAPEDKGAHADDVRQVTTQSRLLLAPSDVLGTS